MGFLDFDIWSFLLIIGVGQGIILCLVLIGKSSSNLSAKILWVLLFILTANLTEYLLLNSRYYIYVIHLMRVTHPLLFLIGPMFYLFIRAQMNSEFRLTRLSILHLIPFAFALVYIFPWLSSSADFKVFVYERSLRAQPVGIGLRGFLYPFFHMAQTLSYVIAAFISLKRLGSNNQSITSFSIKKLRFLLQFSKTFIVYWVLQLLGLLAIVFFQYYVLYIDYGLALLNSLFIQVLTFTILLKPSIHSGSSISRKYQHSSLSEVVHKDLLEKITHSIKEEELFLDSDLTLQKFSDLLDVNKNYISQVINQEFGCGFNDYINTFRVEKAQSLLNDPVKDNLKLLGIAFEAGFNNKTSFTRVFKKKTGKSPSDYRQDLMARRKKVGNN